MSFEKLAEWCAGLMKGMIQLTKTKSNSNVTTTSCLALFLKCMVEQNKIISFQGASRSVELAGAFL